jgi:hypothetical protein
MRWQCLYATVAAAVVHHDDFVLVATLAERRRDSIGYPRCAIAHRDQPRATQHPASVMGVAISSDSVVVKPQQAIDLIQFLYQRSPDEI